MSTQNSDFHYRPKIWVRAATVAIVTALLAACAGSRSTGPVPDGHYRVQRGDNLYRISLRFGQPASRLAAWNKLSRPDQLEVGQLLRVRRSTRAAAPPRHSDTASAVSPTRLQFQWPVRGPVLSPYNGTTQKGIDIGGSRGTPVKAAAAGKVLYAGNEVRGYGNLILIRHNSSTLTAYAHNDALQVRKDQSVLAGETIATMGDSGTDRVKLHFEIRTGGKAVNPESHLPKK